MRFLKHAIPLLFAMLASPVMAADEIVVYSARNEQLIKPPYRDGTTHVIFEPLDFIARLAALIP